MGRQVPSQQTQTCHLCEGPTDTDTRDSCSLSAGPGHSHPMVVSHLAPPCPGQVPFPVPGAGQSVFGDRHGEGCCGGKATPPAAAAAPMPLPAPLHAQLENPNPSGGNREKHLTGQDRGHVGD